MKNQYRVTPKRNKSQRGDGARAENFGLRDARAQNIKEDKENIQSRSFSEKSPLQMSAAEGGGKFFSTKLKTKNFREKTPFNFEKSA